MSEILLTIVFFINGNPMIVEGWMPLKVESIEICELRREYLLDQLDSMYGDKIEYKVFCGTHKQTQQKIDILKSESA